MQWNVSKVGTYDPKYFIHFSEFEAVCAKYYIKNENKKFQCDINSYKKLTERWLLKIQNAKIVYFDPHTSCCNAFVLFNNNGRTHPSSVTYSLNNPKLHLPKHFILFKNW